MTGLIAAVAVVAAVGGYVHTLDGGGEPPSRRDDRVAATTLARVHEQITSGGVAVPARMANAVGVGPDGYHLRVTLSAGSRAWHVGPKPPTKGSVASAERRVGVAVRAGRVRPGDLAVEVWP
ncbi:MAG: hypothetical protein ABEI99_03485 [Halobaculum sp.]